MPNELTKQEVEADLAATEKDVARLQRIVENLQEFIQDSDEDRRCLRVHLMVFENLLQQGQNLLIRINKKLEDFS